MRLKTFNLVALLLVLGLALLGSNAIAKPTAVNWKLGQDTREVLYVVPDLGVRLIFPFDLGDMDPVLSTTLTNPAYFTVPDLTGQSGAISADLLQNHLTLMVDKAAIEPVIDRMNGSLVNPMIGYLYLSAGGFNLTIELRATLDRRQSPSNVFFDITQAERDYLITESVQRRTAAIEREYQKKVAELDLRAREQALALVGELSMVAPAVTRIRESGVVRTPQGHVIELRIKALHEFDSFSTLQLTIINNNSSALGINDLTLYQLGRDDSRVEIPVAHRCDGMMERFGERECVLSSQDTTIDDAAELLLEIDTNVGSGGIKW